MPISAIDGCSETHWAEVRAILSASIEGGGFEPNVVSAADDVGIIQKRIIQNLYDNPIVVCDVSGKNPNVMFELGLRLAFDKPTVIVKDDATTYSFDTAPIEHLVYPRDLRYAQIVEFQRLLSDKVRATHERSISDPSYTTFLKHFGEFTVAKIDKKEVTGLDFILGEIKDVHDALKRLELLQRRADPRRQFLPTEPSTLNPLLPFVIPMVNPGNASRVARALRTVPGVADVAANFSGNHAAFTVRAVPDLEEEDRHVMERRVNRILEEAAGG